jgi:hypothetical protein
MAEITPRSGGPNRLFLVLAVGLAGLLVLGLIAVGGILLIPRVLAGTPPPAAVRTANTPTRPIVLVTQASTPTAVPTEAPLPTLVNPGGAVQVTAVPTASPTESAAGGQLPQSGIGEDLMLLAGGVGLIMVMFAARRARAV